MTERKNILLRLDPAVHDALARCTSERGGGDAVTERKSILLRLDPAVHDALAHWAADELRSTNAQIEYLLRRALADAGRLPKDTGPIPRRGRPARSEAEPDRRSDDLDLIAALGLDQRQEDVVDDGESRTKGATCEPDST